MAAGFIEWSLPSAPLPANALRGRRPIGSPGRSELVQHLARPPD